MFLFLCKSEYFSIVYDMLGRFESKFVLIYLAQKSPITVDDNKKG